MTDNHHKHDKQPYITKLEELTGTDENYRTTIWTGEKMQVIAMSIEPGEEAGVEVHRQADQFILIREGIGLCRMGPEREEFNFERTLTEDTMIFIPRDTWHNIINTSGAPLKLYTIYSGPEYDPGTIHTTKDEALTDVPKDTER